MQYVMILHNTNELVHSIITLLSKVFHYCKEFILSSLVAFSILTSPEYNIIIKMSPTLQFLIRKNINYFGINDSLSAQIRKRTL